MNSLRVLPSAKHMLTFLFQSGRGGATVGLLLHLVLLMGLSAAIGLGIQRSPIECVYSGPAPDIADPRFIRLTLLSPGLLLCGPDLSRWSVLFPGYPRSDTSELWPIFAIPVIYAISSLPFALLGALMARRRYRAVIAVVVLFAVVYPVAHIFFYFAMGYGCWISD